MGEGNLSGLLTAFRFLTILPLGRGKVVDAPHMARSMAFFPLVGAWLGLLLLLMDRVLVRVFPHLVVAALLVGILALITGGLHLDGFADTLDGLFGGRGDRARTLDIMKDSRIGAMGVVGLVVLLGIKFTSIDSMGAAYKGGALVLMPTVARWSQVQLAFKATYARKEGSLAQPFVENLEISHFLAASAGAALVSYIAAGVSGLIVLAGAGIVTMLAKLYFTRRIGGITGDTIGAVSEMNEVLVLLAFLVIGGV